MEHLIGRLHPLLVHLPIGFLLMAFLLELLSLGKRWKKLRRAVPAALHLGIIAGILAVSTGLMLAEEGGQEDDLVFRHKLFSILSVAVAVLLAILIRLGKPIAGKAVRMLLFIFMVCSITLAGHFGGSMTHGRDYLLPNTESPISAVRALPNPEALSGPNLLMYRDLVRPILAEKCYSCHSDRKQKGNLRLDSESAITLGGKHGSILEGGGELVSRISISVEEKGHMPPREKDQLTGMEIGIITAWVKDGASFTRPADSVVSQVVKDAIRSYSSVSSDGLSWLPDSEGADIPDEGDLKSAQIPGIRVTPVYAESPWLEVVAVGPEKWQEAHWKIWDKFSASVVSARFSFSGLSDDQIPKIAVAPNLRRLSVDHTGITDEGIRHLKVARNLQRINLSANRITGDGIVLIGELPSMQQIFAFGCALDTTAIKIFHKKFPRIRLEAGQAKLPFLNTDTLEYR